MSSVNASLNQTDILDGISICLAEAISVAYVVRCALGVCGVITNTLIIAVVWKSSTLHTKAMINIALCSLADILYCTMNVFLCTYSLYHTYYKLPMVTTQFACMSYLWLYLYFLNLAFFYTTVLAMDRLLAVALPVWYKNVNSTKYICTVRVVASLCAIFWPLAELAEASDSRLIPLCSVAYGTNDLYRHVYIPFTAVQSVITMVLCLMTVVIMCYRLRKARLLGHCMIATHKALEVRMIKTVVAHCCLYIFSWFLLVLAANLFRHESHITFTKYVSYFVCAAMISPVISIFVYLVCLNQFRDEFRLIVLKIQPKNTNNSNSDPRSGKYTHVEHV